VGDLIQFARYADTLAQQGAEVVLQVPERLRSLAESFAGVARVCAPGQALPEFDFWVPLMSLPHATGTELSTIPAKVPYLRTDPMRIERWSGWLPRTGLKVGLAWAGNAAHARDRYRSLPFRALAPLFELAGVFFVSLQKEPRAGDRELFPPGDVLLDLAAEFSDFADTAAAIDSLDLVISVDTSVAHLAGALGKPVWLLLPEIGDFRWLERREDSPWYPTMRLFRQSRLGDWDEVVTRVRCELSTVLDRGIEIAGDVAAGNGANASSPNTFDIEAIEAPPLARVTEARHGIFQYWPGFDAATRSLVWYGDYIESHLCLLSRFVRAGTWVMEVGSGIGVHAVPLARTVGADGHLFVYEAHAPAKRLLQQNLAANGVGGIVTVMRRCLAGPSAGDRAELTTLTPDTPTEAIDELWVERLDLLKIGHDQPALAILDGACETIWRLRPVLFISTGDRVPVDVAARRASELGYRCWRFDAPLFDPANFNRRDSDIFNGATTTALLAIPEERELAADPEGCVEIRA
jgi:hypothetical protein